MERDEGVSPPAKRVKLEAEADQSDARAEMERLRAAVVTAASEVQERASTLDSLCAKAASKLDEAALVARMELEQERAALAADKAAFEAEKAAMMKTGVRGSDVLEINAGGEVLSVQRSTLCVVEGSMLAAMFSGRWEDRVSKDAHGRIFLDYSPYCFKKVVDYLRSVVMDGTDAARPIVAPDMEPTFRKLVRYLNLENPMFPSPANRFGVGANYTVSADGLTITKSSAANTNFDVVAVLDGAGGFDTEIRRWQITIIDGACHLLGIVKACSLAAVRARQDPSSHPDVRLLDTSSGNKFPSGIPYAGARCNAASSVIGVVLDCNARTLSFTINSADKGIAYADLEMSQPWTLCCMLLQQNASVRLEV